MTAEVLKVRGTFANLRREPSHASELVSQLVLGEEARIVEDGSETAAPDSRSEWLRVEGPDGYPGWVHARSLVSTSPTREELIWTRRDGVLRQSPDPPATPLCDLVLGARVAMPTPSDEAPTPAHETSRSAADSSAREASRSTVSGHRRRRVLLADGGVGWADAEGWVTASALSERYPPTGEAVVHTALGLLGVPYLWGGTSSKAFDCSGFVQRVFGLHGVRLPRDAYQQAEVGERVEPPIAGDGLRAGDLLFFAERGPRVSHVAIAVGEEGRFVHSSTFRAGVAIDSLNPSDSRYAQRLAAMLSGCRRVL
jgi:cell wall-associated NlpC family hydrolase